MRSRAKRDMSRSTTNKRTRADRDAGAPIVMEARLVRSARRPRPCMPPVARRMRAPALTFRVPISVARDQLRELLLGPIPFRAGRPRSDESAAPRSNPTRTFDSRPIRHRLSHHAARIEDGARAIRRRLYPTVACPTGQASEHACIDDVVDAGFLSRLCPRPAASIASSSIARLRSRAALLVRWIDHALRHAAPLRAASSRTCRHSSSASDRQALSGSATERLALSAGTTAARRARPAGRLVIVSLS